MTTAIPSEYQYRYHPYRVASLNIPMIIASSGSMGNNGALTGLTALQTTYASCYLYLPASAISAGSAAGWYYAVMSSTTAGTVYNNTYTTGIPTIPSSPTAFATTGPGAFTGDTSEQGISITVPGNILGKNGALDVWALWAQTANANSKTVRMRWSGSSGTQFVSEGPGSNATTQDARRIWNCGVTNVQRSYASGNSAFGSSSQNHVDAAVDTTADSTFYISTQHATATDNAAILAAQIVAWYAP